MVCRPDAAEQADKVETIQMNNLLQGSGGLEWVAFFISAGYRRWE
jgi:hypothetical protein